MFLIRYILDNKVKKCLKKSNKTSVQCVKKCLNIHNRRILSEFQNYLIVCY